MERNKKLMEKALTAIESSGYEIQSKAEEGEDIFKIDYYDVRHFAKYSFTGKFRDENVFISIVCAFPSGMDEDITDIIQGKMGPISINNMGNARECKVEYKVKADDDSLKNLNICCLLKEVEDSIYSVRYRKSFAL